MEWLKDFLEKLLRPKPPIECPPVVEPPIHECECLEEKKVIVEQKIELEKKDKMIEMLDAENLVLKARVEELTPKGIIALELAKDGKKEFKWVSDYRISKNFMLSEFMVDGLDYLKLDMRIVDVMQKIRNHFNKPVNISSGYRSKYKNKDVGGVINSTHLKGLACDFKVSGVNKNVVLAYVKILKEVKYSYTNNTNMKYSVHVNV